MLSSKLPIFHRERKIVRSGQTSKVKSNADLQAPRLGVKKQIEEENRHIE